jgi:hypothetical protein
MKHPAPQRIQVVELDALVPAVACRNAILYDSKHLSIHRKQSDGLIPDGRQGSGGGKFSHVESDEIGHALMQQLIEVSLRRANDQADTRIQRPRR